MDFRKWDKYDGNEDIDKIDEDIKQDEIERKLNEEERKLLSEIEDKQSTFQSYYELYKYEASETQVEYSYLSEDEQNEKKKIAEQKEIKYQELNGLYEVILKLLKNFANFRKELKELNPNIHSKRIIEKCKSIEDGISLLDKELSIIDNKMKEESKEKEENDDEMISESELNNMKKYFNLIKLICYTSMSRSYYELEEYNISMEYLYKGQEIEPKNSDLWILRLKIAIKLECYLLCSILLEEIERIYRNDNLSVIKESKSYENEINKIVFDENRMKQIRDNILNSNNNNELNNYNNILFYAKRYYNEGVLLCEMNFYKSSLLRHKLSLQLLNDIKIKLSKFYINHIESNDNLIEKHEYLLHLYEDNYIDMMKCYSQINSSSVFEEAMKIRSLCLSINCNNGYLFYYSGMIYYQNNYYIRAYYEMKICQRYIVFDCDKYKDIEDDVNRMIEKINFKYKEIYSKDLNEVYTPEPNILLIFTSGEKINCSDNNLQELNKIQNTNKNNKESDNNSNSKTKVVSLSNNNNNNNNSKFDPVQSLNNQTYSYRKWLIDHGTYFKYHRTSVGGCCPGRATLLTGQYSKIHGVNQSDFGMKNISDKFMRYLEPNGVATLGNYLSDSGYDTVFKGLWNLSYTPPTILNRSSSASNLNLLERSNSINSINGSGGSVGGNDKKESPKALSFKPKSNSDGLNPFGFGQWDEDNKFERGPERDIDTTNKVIEWLQDRNAVVSMEKTRGSQINPFLLCVGLSGPGDTWDLLRGIHRQSNDKGNGQLPCHDVNSNLMKTLYKTRQSASFYEKRMRETDDCIGNILHCLFSTQFANDTIVIFTSDCGEMLGNHDLYGCCYNGYEESMRIPLVFAGGPLNWSQHIINKDCYTSSIDIAPTILSLCCKGNNNNNNSNNNTSNAISNKAARKRSLSFTELHRFPGHDLSYSLFAGIKPEINTYHYYTNVEEPYRCSNFDYCSLNVTQNNNYPYFGNRFVNLIIEKVEYDNKLEEYKLISYTNISPLFGARDSTYAYKDSNWILMSIPSETVNIENDYELYNLTEDPEEKHNLMKLVGKEEQTNYIFYTLKLKLNKIEQKYIPNEDDIDKNIRSITKPSIKPHTFLWNHKTVIVLVAFLSIIVPLFLIYK